MLASTYEVLSVVFYLALVIVVASRKPQKNYFSTVLATPFMFLSESFILILVWKFHKVVMDFLCNGLYCRYTPHFGVVYSGMSYDGIPWVLFFHNGLFWGIPLLAFSMWFQARRQKRREDLTNTPDMPIMQEDDEIERVKRMRESFKKKDTSLRKIFLLFILFMVWDLAVEYFPVQSRLWSYPCTTFTFGRVSFLKIFFVGLAGPILCFVNILIESRGGRELLPDQVGPPKGFFPRARQRGWAWNILIRVISYNLTILLLWLSLAFMARNDEELLIGLIHSVYGG
jgi:hypothetical protein